MNVVFLCVCLFFHSNSTNVKPRVQHGQYCILLDESHSRYIVLKQ